jgi:hypothetical protein
MVEGEVGGRNRRDRKTKQKKEHRRKGMRKEMKKGWRKDIELLFWYLL